MYTKYDERTERRLASLLPQIQWSFRGLIVIANVIAEENGCDARAISGTRTYAEQADLYAQGRTKPGNIVTRAKPGYSNHNFGIAIDLGIFRSKKYLDDGTKEDKKLVSSIYRRIAKYTKFLGIDWGGNWQSIVDEPHFEFNTGLTLTQMRDRVAKNKSILNV